MAAYNELDVVGQNKARQKRLRVLAEIGCILLFILFMLPFFIVLMNSMRTNAEIINSAVGMPENPKVLFENITAVWNNPTFNFLKALKDSVIITVLSLAIISVCSRFIISEDPAVTRTGMSIPPSSSLLICGSFNIISVPYSEVVV